MNPSRRNALLIALGSIAAGYAFYRNDAFWGIALSGFAAIWALFYALPLMDSGWRLRAGFVLSTFLATCLSLWPTAGQAGLVKCPRYIQDRIDFAVVRGLDLSGGLRLVYTVEVEEAIRDKRNRYADDMRAEFATIYGFHKGEGNIKREELKQVEEKVHVAAPPSESAIIRVLFKDPADASKIDERFLKRFQNELAQSKGIQPGETVFKIRAEVESGIRERAVSQAKDTVNRRVDGLGLREASVTTRDEDIIVEVPGEDQKTFNNIKETVRKTARLEFKMVDDEADFFGKTKDTDFPEGEGLVLESENAPAGPEKTVQTHYIRIVKRPTETMNEARDRLKRWLSTLSVPDDHQVGMEATRDSQENGGAETGWRTFYLYNRAEITGDQITDATTGPNQGDNGGYQVGIRFSPAGADRFEEVTGANVKRRFAIILDDIINSAPHINTKIAGGSASITMGAGSSDEQLQHARELELVLKSGALPAPISASNESLIGPSLGKDAIHEAIIGFLIGSGLVLVCMIIYYRKSGIVADLAVSFNLLLQLAILSSFNATMTLPGICGLALTIGMSVDANVLINERIREELRAGRTVRAAVESGYEKAFWSIFDGHLTVLITGLILAQYGTGPVKGFAITLIIGILASFFTGVFCTRIVFDWWVKGAKVKRLSVGAEF